ncbi:hypothetical protein OXT66_07545 [Lentilactobacillus senioris]|uniref:hypothetical protein n=1 Tax=Lentilactobacillus senioris TaxID=931534 RepID=UPI00227E8962|nr:hypothetical protein [Lentilactobacillus senioris]MCY9807386.1 hypothetical protein [Lentilactobacillus senioris]
MKFKHYVLAGLTALSFGMVVCTSPVSAKTLPKSYLGVWISKPVYTYGTKHINKNMAIPKMKMSVTSKTVKYRFYGYLPQAPGVHYNKSIHTLKLKKAQKDFYTLSGKRPFGKFNYLAKVGKHLHYAYQNGGEIIFTKMK